MHKYSFISLVLLLISQGVWGMSHSGPINIAHLIDPYKDQTINILIQNKLREGRPFILAQFMRQGTSWFCEADGLHHQLYIGKRGIPVSYFVFYSAGQLPHYLGSYQDWFDPVKSKKMHDIWDRSYRRDRKNELLAKLDPKQLAPLVLAGLKKWEEEAPEEIEENPNSSGCSLFSKPPF